MRLNLFRRILDETVVEVNGSVPQTITRLCAQNGSCRQLDTYGNTMWFNCTKKGKMTVFCGDESSDLCPPLVDLRPYSVVGRVVAENGKTLVKIHTIYSRVRAALQWLFVLLMVILFPLRFLLNGSSAATVAASVVLALVMLLIFLATGASEPISITVDQERAKEAILNRVEALEHWDD